MEAWNGLLVEQSALLENESWSMEAVVVDGGFSGGGVASSCSVSTGSLLPSRMETSEGLVLARRGLCGRLLWRIEWMLMYAAPE